MSLFSSSQLEAMYFRGWVYFAMKFSLLFTLSRYLKNRMAFSMCFVDRIYLKNIAHHARNKVNRISDIHTPAPSSKGIRNIRDKNAHRAKV